MSLGSNLGDRVGQLAAGLEILARFEEVLAVSDVYETAPVGGVEQPAYLNLVAVLDTTCAERALGAAHSAEESRGRLRRLRWGPRTLDVDVISVAGHRRNDPRLTLPHPRALERAFVLRPWLDVDPDAEIPGAGRVADLLARLDPDEVREVRRLGPLPGWWR
jgi:2-amino-4-hydroxy-6-hydroxymethyldihydropteridine diphosphokinase